MTDLSPRNVLKFPERERQPLRLVRDCQGEGLHATLHAMAGISPELAEKQARARAASRAKDARAEAFKDHVLAVGLDEAFADWERFLKGVKS